MDDEKSVPQNSSGDEEIVSAGQNARHDEQAIRHAFETGEYPHDKKLSRKAYEKKKRELQTELEASKNRTFCGMI